MPVMGCFFYSKAVCLWRSRGKKEEVFLLHCKPQKGRMKGVCFSFCQLEFPFQIPFWLYDQATAVFMGGHSLPAGAYLVKKEVFSP